ncbi:MAG: methyl-accepting chemotaxis protein, partial [Burkholderiales bacterium]|nr:methyl-accepting chemotaxis protein [Burkholderiales bacterium]
AGTLLTTMIPAIHKTSNLVQEIASASQEQNQGLSHINQAMNQLRKGTQQNAAAAAGLAETAGELSDQAGQLQGLVGFFNLDVKVAVTSPVLKGTATKARRTLAIAM